MPLARKSTSHFLFRLNPQTNPIFQMHIIFTSVITEATQDFYTIVVIVLKPHI